MMDNELSEFFTLKEMLKSSTAIRKGIPNKPNQKQYACMRALCVNVLDPVRTRWGAFVVSSGFRSAKLNKAIGGSTKSQHSLGQAGDFEIVGKNNKSLFHWMRKHLKFDQLILEHHIEGDDNSGWIHCSWVEPTRNEEGEVIKDLNRNEALIFDGKTYKKVV